MANAGVCIHPRRNRSTLRLASRSLRSFFRKTSLPWPSCILPTVIPSIAAVRLPLFPSCARRIADCGNRSPNSTARDSNCRDCSCSTDRVCVERRGANPLRPDHPSPRMFPPSPQPYRFLARLRPVHGFPVLRLLRGLRPLIRSSPVSAASSVRSPSDQLRFPCSSLRLMSLRLRALPLAILDGGTKEYSTARSDLIEPTSREF